MTTMVADLDLLRGRRAARLAAAARGAGVALLLLVPGATWWYHSRLVTAGEAVNAAAAQVVNVMKRRADLIPALVAVTATHAREERAVLDSLSGAASSSNASAPISIPDDNRAAAALTTRLLAVGDRYPELKASRTYVQLRFELLGTENRIATERARYVEAVLAYRTLRRDWPASLVARAFAFPDSPPY